MQILITLDNNEKSQLDIMPVLKDVNRCRRDYFVCLKFAGILEFEITNDFLSKYTNYTKLSDIEPAKLSDTKDPIVFNYKYFMEDASRRFGFSYVCKAIMKATAYSILDYIGMHYPDESNTSYIIGELQALTSNQKFCIEQYQRIVTQEAVLGYFTHMLTCALNKREEA